MSEEEREDSHEPSMASAWNVNLLCLVGASIGIVALFVAWINEPPTMPGPWHRSWEPSVVYMLTNHYLYYGASAVFLIGTMAALASPLGGTLQSAGLIIFAIGIIDSGSDTWLDGIDPQQTLNIGMYLGIASCALVITSLFKPIGTGSLHPRGSRKIGLMERLLTITPSIVEKGHRGGEKGLRCGER